MPATKLKIAIFPLGPAIGVNSWDTYHQMVDFVHQRKGFSFKWLAHAYTVTSFVQDEICFRLKAQFKSFGLGCFSRLTDLTDYLFQGGLIRQFINGELSEHEFFIAAIKFLNIDLPIEKDDKLQLEKEFWAAFMAHHTMIPSTKIQSFLETLAQLSPIIPVAITRATRPCMTTTQQKLLPFGMQLTTAASESTYQPRENLLCVNKKTGELTSAAEDAVALALEATPNIANIKKVSVYILGHFVKDTLSSSRRIGEAVTAKLSCPSRVKFYPFDVKKGHTLASICARFGLLRNCDVATPTPLITQNKTLKR